MLVEYVILYRDKHIEVRFIREKEFQWIKEIVELQVALRAMSRYGSSLFFYPHMLLPSLSRRYLMKPQELTVLCRYSEGEVSMIQIIQSSFDTFLRKELQNVENHLSSIV